MASGTITEKWFFCSWNRIIKKENDEESLYDSYDDGIPIKFLINKGRLDFSKIMYESTEKNETNNIK